ncbi:hypothetical protein BCS42_08770 [Crenothrix sp. D3]|jgi:hypothetical protein|nr:hypothetical protein BCS42_08770 [Crenothrix sp. D3]
MERKIFALIVLLAVVPLTAWSAEPAGSYLYEQLKNPTYNKTFNALFKGQRIEPWLKEYLKSRDGVDSPSEMREVGGKTYEFYNVCEPHNCGGSNIYVFFESGGAQAWALFTKENEQPRFFGNPDAQMQQVLKDASQ